MSVAFVVTAHRGAAQLGRLSRRLLAPGTSVFLHVDRRTSDAVHREILAALPRDPALRLVPRVKSPWSSWGTVQAPLEGIRAVLESDLPADHIALMSGQCYPLRPAAAIAEFLAVEAPEQSFCPTWSLPWRHYAGNGGLERVMHWHRPILRRRFRIPIDRRYPEGLRPYGGSAFMVLDRTTAQWLIRYTDEHPEVVAYHRHVWAPDEHYIHTVIQSAGDPNRLLDEHLWHIEWNGSRAKHPEVLRADDLPALVDASHHSSEAGGGSRAKLFARKFDPLVDPDVLDGVDRELLHVDPDPR